MVLQCAEGTEARFNLSQKIPNSYTSLGFYAWYAIANSVPGYNINNACIRRIKAMLQAKKGSKNTRLKGMDEFLQAELEIGQTVAARHKKKPAEESHKKCLRGSIAKCTRSQSTKASSSQKKT